MLNISQCYGNNGSTSARQAGCMSKLHLLRNLSASFVMLLPFVVSACGDEMIDANDETDQTGADAGDRDSGTPLTVGPGDGSHLFDPSRVASVQIVVSEEDLAILRSDADKPMNSDDFTYVSARLTYDGVEFANVGLRVKGNNSRVGAPGDAVPFKIDMNRNVEEQQLDGQTKINLHNNVNQPAAMNEYLSYGAFRDYGLAASRTGWADVSLNGSVLGLYTLVEQVNEKMLARYYDDPEAALYKPESPAGNLTYLGDSIEDYENVDYEADEETDHATFLRLTKMLAEEPVTTWDSVIDIESVLTYFAGNVALGNWDTYVVMGHNYYLFEATQGRMTMLPWDMNLSQGATGVVCPADLRGGGGGFGGGDGVAREPPMNFNGSVPTDGRVPSGIQGGGGAPGGFGGGAAPLYDGLIADATYFARYIVILKRFLAGAGSMTTLHARIDAAVAALGERVTPSAVEELRSSITNRVAAIEAAIPTTSSCAAVSGFR
jgi:spore coat protein CotH